MPTTPIYALPYPAAADPADVPLDMQELAERVEAVLPSGGGMVKIANFTLASPAATIDFTSIPQTYAHLQLLCVLRSENAAYNVGATVRMNADSGGNYHNMRFRTFGTTVTAVENLAYSGVAIDITGTSAGTLFAPLRLDLPHYTDAAQAQAILSSGSYWQGGGAGNHILQHGECDWATAAAVTRITIAPSSGNLSTGSRATLYGLS